MKNKSKLAILIPAFNESLILKNALEILLRFIKAKDIYVVNDGSTDNTEKVAKKYIKNVLSLPCNEGKAKAMNFGLKKFKLADHYDYIMPMDADTKVTPTFFNQSLAILEVDKKQKIACVAGKVIGSNHSWLTSYRLWEYEVSQSIHKKAQGIEKAIVVCPGCSTIYRSKIFKKISIPNDTLTEDMDLTFEIHRKKLGEIVYANMAAVITQDPDNLKNYITQTNRWYAGFWQCVLKHNIPWGGQALDFEVALLASEGLFAGLTVLSLIFLLPFILPRNSILILVPFLIDFFLFFFPSVFLTAKHYKKFEILKFLPHFYFIRFLGSILFLNGFIKTVLGLDLSMQWNKLDRYKFAEGKTC